MKQLLNMMGVTDAERVRQVSIAFHGLSLFFGSILAILLVAGTFALLLRFSQGLPVWQKVTLATLRSLLLLMILLLLMRPVLLLTVEGSIRQQLLLLIDTSQSMQLVDGREEPSDLARAAIARGLIDPRGGVGQDLSGLSSINQIPRSEVLKSMLTNNRLQLLKKLAKNYDLEPYTFGKTLQAGSLNKSSPGTAKSDDSGGFLDGLTFDKPATAIGDSIRSLLDLKKGQPVGGIFLITDGGNNYGSSPMYAATLAQQAKVPLYIYGVGIAAPHDIIVSQLNSPEVMFAGEETLVRVQLHSQAMKGQTAQLNLRMGGELIDSKPVTFNEDGDQEIPMKFKPTQKGDFELEASIDPLPEEANKENNQAFQRIRIIDGKINVLYIERSPRWEFRYLQALLIRDPRFDAKFVLLGGDEELSEEENSPYLAKIPTKREDWMKYDVVILGDVDADVLKAEQKYYLQDLISNMGGGLIFLAGKKFMPNGYRGTSLESMIPVDFESQFSPDLMAITKPVGLNLTAYGKDSPTLRLADKDEESTQIWNDLPGIFWDAHVAEAKPAAQVLLNDPSPDKTNRVGPMSVIAIQSYGAGQTMFIGTDEIWRWRRNVGEKYYTRLWGQFLLRLGLPRLMGASKKTQLTTEKKDYVTGEVVKISGRLFQDDNQPLTLPTVISTVTVQPDKEGGSDALTKTVLLRSLPARPGFYEGEVTAARTGIYSLKMENDPFSSLDFRVGDSHLESSETALNIQLLQNMAAASGGHFYREEDLYKMLEEPDDSQTAPADQISTASAVPNGLNTGERVPSTREVDLSFNPFYYFLMLIVVTAEWILRKRWHLV